MLRQFKLTSGEEIVCEVIEEPQEDDDVNLVIRNPMLIITGFSPSGDVRYYSFKPWMTFQLREGYFQLLNYTHIVGEAKPNIYVQEQYKKNLEMELKNDDKEKSLSDAMEDAFDEIAAALVSTDSASSNVINFSFKNKDKMH